MAPSKSAWAPDRSLTNAKFEGYKHSFDDDDADDQSSAAAGEKVLDRGLRHIQLDAQALPGRSLRGGSDSRLGYKQARSRARWNHLSVGRGQEVAWMDSAGSFWMIDLSTSNTSAERILTLSEPIETIASTSDAAVIPEYPAAQHLQDSLWACSDGFGTLYIVDSDKKSILSSHELLEADSNDLLPFALNAATVSGTDGYAILSGSTPSSSSSKSSTPFRVDIVRFSITEHSGSSSPLNRITKLRGTDLPTYTAFTDGKAIIGSSSKYREAGASESQPDTENNTTSASTEKPYEPKPDEIVGVPRKGQESQPVSAEAPPPYSWNQTSDSLTIAFPLPTTVNVKDIKVVFRPKAVSLMIANASETQHSIPLPKLDTAKLWDEIDAGVSTWTWERTGGDKGKFGLLALHLEKKHEDTRWVHVFQQDDNPHLQKSYFEVDETLDRSELLRITEAMEKFTEDLASTAGGAKSNFDQRSSLLGEELDMEVDAPDISSGKGITFTWIDDISSSNPAVSTDSDDEVVEYISTALPTSSNALPSIIVKHDVDGLLFEPPSKTSEHWTHVSTYPALAFVLASKRDVVHVYHHSSKLAIGLEMGTAVGTPQAQNSSIAASKMNAYLYFPPSPGSKAKTAPQKVVRLGETSAGAVLGAVAVEHGENLDVAVLCERELILLRNVL